MNKILVHTLIVSFILCLTFVSTPSVFGNMKAFPEVRQEGGKIIAGQGYLRQYDGIKFMHLKGTPREIGIQHGLLLSQDLGIDNLLKMRNTFDPFAYNYEGLEALSWAFRKFYFNTKLLPTILRNTPEEYFEEIMGIGLGLTGGAEQPPLEDIVMSSVFQDLALTYGCTSFAMWGQTTADGGLIHGRNLDSIGQHQIAQTGYVTVYEPTDGYPFITHIYPVSAGIMQGMNIHGIVVSMNYSTVQKDHQTLDGMPFTLLLRKVLQYAGTLEDALEIVKHTPRTIGLNIVISDAKIPKAVVIETSKNRYAVREQPNYLFATNRFKSDYMMAYQSSGWLSSAVREQRLAEIQSGTVGTFSPERAAEILRDKFSPHSLAHQELVFGINNPATLLTTIFQPDTGLMWVGMLNNERTAADRTLQAFSLDNALNGQEPRVWSKDIPATSSSPYFHNWSLARKASIEYSKGNYEQVLNTLAHLDDSYQETQTAVKLRADSLLRTGEFAKSEREMESLLTKEVVQPYQELQTLSQLGVLKDMQGERETALSLYQQALDVTVPDLVGDDDTYLRIAQAGLIKPLAWDSQLVKAIKVPFSGSPVSEPDYSDGVGRIINDVVVLGSHQASIERIKALVGLSPGDKLDVEQLALAAVRLSSLDVFSQVELVPIPIGDDYVDVVIHIEEGFGWYNDPVELVVNSLLDFSNKEINLKYRNLGGTLTVMQAGYGWSKKKPRSLLLAGPLYRGRLSINYAQETSFRDLDWGAYRDSSYSYRDTVYSGQWNYRITPNIDLTLKGSYLSQKVESTPQIHNGLVLCDGDYFDLSMQASATAPSTWSLAPYNWHVTVEGGSIVGTSDLTKNHLRLNLAAKTYLPMGKVNVLVLNGMGGLIDSAAPWLIKERYGLQGYPGDGYALLGGELQHHFAHNLHAAIFLNTAHIWEKTGDDVHGETVTAVGVAGRYQTPIGPELQINFTRNITKNTSQLQIGFVNSF